MIAELLTMPVLLRDDLDDESVHEMQLVENIEREDLDPLEEAAAFELLRVKYGYSVEKIADKITEGKGPSYVYKRLTLNKLVQEAREAMYADAGARRVAGAAHRALRARRPGPRCSATSSACATRTRATGRRSAGAGRAGQGLQHRAGQARRSTPTAPTCCPRPAAASNARSAPPTSACCSTTPTPGPDSCTDSACFQTKREAHVVVLRKRPRQGRAEGHRADEALRAKSGAKGVLVGFKRLDATAYTERGNDGKEREVTFADALRGMGKKAPKHRILIDPHTLEPIPVITASSPTSCSRRRRRKKSPRRRS
jgi:hypothetical protein